MTDASWDEVIERLAATQRAFANGAACGLKDLYSHGEDVTVFDGLGRLDID